MSNKSLLSNNSPLLDSPRNEIVNNHLMFSKNNPLSLLSTCILFPFFIQISDRISNSRFQMLLHYHLMHTIPTVIADKAGRILIKFILNTLNFIIVLGRHCVMQHVHTNSYTTVYMLE